jgi:putative copper export protein
MEETLFDLPGLLAALDGEQLVQLVSRVLHILGAIVLAGGLFYIRSVLSPAGVDACFAGRRAVWAKWVGIATLLLLVTGIYNFLVINNQVKADGGKLEPTYHMLFGIKFLLGLLVMFLAAMLSGKTAAAEKFRANMGRWLNIAWFAVVAIVVLAAMLRTLH